MVSKASEDLPEPESPVRTTSWSRGSSTSMFLRLCSRAPRTTIRSLAMDHHYGGPAGSLPTLRRPRPPRVVTPSRPATPPAPPPGPGPLAARPPGPAGAPRAPRAPRKQPPPRLRRRPTPATARSGRPRPPRGGAPRRPRRPDRKSTRLNSSHLVISYAVFCLKKKKTEERKHLGQAPYPTLQHPVNT